MLRKILLSAVCALAVVACGKTVDGLLTNTEVLTFAVKNKSVSVPAGRWETKIKFPSKKEVKLDIAVAGQKNVEVSFKVPKGAPLPQENGTFELASQDSGQPYDVQGEVKTTYVDSHEQWSWESCSYEIRRQECYYNQQGQPVCYWVVQTVHGQRDVRYYLRDTTQEVTFNLLAANKTRTPGSFKGVERYTDRVYTYQGMCR